MSRTQVELVVVVVLLGLGYFTKFSHTLFLTMRRRLLSEEQSIKSWVKRIGFFSCVAFSHQDITSDKQTKQQTNKQTKNTRPVTQFDFMVLVEFEEILTKPLWAGIEKKHRINSHLIDHCPKSSGVSQVSERASEWAKRSARAKQEGRNKQTSEQCEWTSKQTSEWPSTPICILGYSGPQWQGDHPQSVRPNSLVGDH